MSREQVCVQTWTEPDGLDLKVPELHRRDVDMMDQQDAEPDMDQTCTGSAVFTLCQMFNLLTVDSPVLSGPASSSVCRCVCSSLIKL